MKTFKEIRTFLATKREQKEKYLSLFTSIQEEVFQTVKTIRISGDLVDLRGLSKYIQQTLQDKGLYNETLVQDLSAKINANHHILKWANASDLEIKAFIMKEKLKARLKNVKKGTSENIAEISRWAMIKTTISARTFATMLGNAIDVRNSKSGIFHGLGIFCISAGSYILYKNGIDIGSFAGEIDVKILPTIALDEVPVSIPTVVAEIPTISTIVDKPTPTVQAHHINTSLTSMTESSVNFTLDTSSKVNFRETFKQAAMTYFAENIHNNPEQARNFAYNLWSKLYSNQDIFTQYLGRVNNNNPFVSSQDFEKMSKITLNLKGKTWNISDLALSK
jgi:hypothetical protein